MSEEPQSRPGQATLAAYLIIGGSIVVVLSAWQRISSLHTLEVQEELAQVLADQPTDLGISVDGLATAVRIMCVIGGGAATAAAILGFQVFQRSATARRVLTALAPLLVIGGLAAGGFFAPMVVAGIALLWVQPTRDWYAGRPWAQRSEQRRPGAGGGAVERPRPDPFATSTPSSSEGSRGASAQTAVQDPPPPAAAQAPWPAAPVQPGQPTPWGPPPVAPRTAAERRAARGPRPSALVTACITAWVGGVMAVVAMIGAGVAVAADRAGLVAEFERQQPDLVGEITETELVASVSVILFGIALWALAAIVLAVLAFLGHDWARVVLAVSAVCAGLLTVVMGLSLPPLLILAGILGTCAWLLLRRDVAEWFRR